MLMGAFHILELSKTCAYDNLKSRRARTYNYDLSLASKAFVAEFVHKRWRRDDLANGLYDAWWYGVHAEGFCQRWTM